MQMQPHEEVFNDQNSQKLIGSDDLSDGGKTDRSEYFVGNFIKTYTNLDRDDDSKSQKPNLLNDKMKQKKAKR